MICLRILREGESHFQGCITIEEASHILQFDEAGLKLFVTIQPWPLFLRDYGDNILQQIEGFIWSYCH